MKSIYQWSATELVRGIHDRRISSIEVVQSCIEQINRHNDSLKAFITLCSDQALENAEAIDQAIADGHSIGPLAGIPFSAKDLTPTVGVRTTFGSKIYENWIPSQDELCVERLKESGAILIGKTNTPEFGMGAHTNNPLYGPTATPYDCSRVSGGSSGGGAVAVSTGMCALSQGTDMGGSVRTPASYCGVVGLRPSAGRIPRPRKPLLHAYLDTDGVMTRTVEDAALMLSVMGRWDARDPIAIAHSFKVPSFDEEMRDQLRGKVKVGFSDDLGIAVVDETVKAVFAEAIAKLDAVCERVEAKYPDCSIAQPAFETLRAALLWHNLKHHYEQHFDVLTDSVRWNVERGRNISAADFLMASAQCDRHYKHFLEFFESYDILATVSACVPPFPHDQPEVLEVNGTPLRNIIDFITITYTISLTGLPALSIPCGFTPTGLPIGMQLIGKPHGEKDLLQFAYLLQEELGFRHRWPDI